MIAEITGDDFEKEVLQSDIPVFACFTNPQCGSCFALHLVAEALAKEYEGTVKFVRINVEQELELAARYRIVPLPAVILFRDSQPVKRLLGFQERWVLGDLLDMLTAKKERLV